MIQPKDQGCNRPLDLGQGCGDYQRHLSIGRVHRSQNLGDGGGSQAIPRGMELLGDRGVQHSSIVLLAQSSLWKIQHSSVG